MKILALTLYSGNYSNGYSFFFPAAGNRFDATGKLGSSGSWGFGWTSTPSDGRAWALEFHAGGSTLYGDFRSHGFSVRCVQASAAVFAFIKKDIEDTFVFFPATGYREFSDGRYSYPGSWGLVWASTPSGGNAWSFTITSGRPYMNANNRGYGFTVRCVQASAAVWTVRKENIEQIRFRRESGKGILCRRGQADSVTRLGCKLFANENRFVCAALSYSISLIKLPVFKYLYFYKHSSGYFLFFPATGFRYLDAKLYNVGTEGHGWTSTPIGGNAWHYGGSSGNVALAVHSREFGFPVRCVQASAPVFVRKDFKKALVFFPASGVRHESDGSLRELGSSGYARTSTSGSGSDAWELIFYSRNACIFSYPCSRGFPVRCVQASAAVFVFTNDTLCFFPATGYRNASGGNLGDSGRWGYGWTSTPNGGNAWYFDFYTGPAHMNNGTRGHGFSVRCVQASAAVWAVRKKTTKQIRFRREFGKACLYRRGRADSVTRLGCKLFVRYSFLPYEALSYSILLIKLPVFKCLYFYKHSSGYFLFFPASGNRSYSSGTLGNSGVSGYCWTSVPSGSNAWYLDVFPSNARVLANVSGGFGFPVRCVQASASVFVYVRKDTEETFVFFPASGYRFVGDGKLVDSGITVLRWSSTPYNSGSAWDLNSRSAAACMYYDSRGHGFSVRCVQASAAVWAVRKENIEQIRFRRESGKGILCRRGQADSVTRLGCKLFANENRFVCAALSYSISLIKLPDLKRLYFYKYSSGYFFFFPAPGYREAGDGKLYNSGGRGDGWSSTPNGDRAMGLLFDSGSVRVYDGHWRGSGFPVRCVQASVLVFVSGIKMPGLFRKCLDMVNDTLAFFPASGYRLNHDGGLRSSGTYGYGWTSTPDGGGGSYLYFSAGGTYISHYDRDSGRSVRCVQASAAVFAFMKEDIENMFVFFPAAGYRHYDSGSLNNSGTQALVWSSVPSGESAYRLYSSPTGAFVTNVQRTYGFSVRCVQASAFVFVFIRKDIEDALFFFPATGNREYNDGSLVYLGMWGHGWSSSPSDGTNAWFFRFSSGVVHVYSGPRTHGLSVRCVQASATVFAFSNYLKRRKKAA